MVDTLCTVTNKMTGGLLGPVGQAGQRRWPEDVVWMSSWRAGRSLITVHQKSQICSICVVSWIDPVSYSAVIVCCWLVWWQSWHPGTAVPCSNSWGRSTPKRIYNFILTKTALNVVGDCRVLPSEVTLRAPGLFSTGVRPIHGQFQITGVPHEVFLCQINEYPLICCNPARMALNPSRPIGRVGSQPCWRPRRSTWQSPTRQYCQNMKQSEK